MKCPKCNTEMRIKSSGYVSNDGKFFNKQVLTCRKKDCPNFGKEVKVIYNPLAVSEDADAAKSQQ